jgi:hypothetical protein
VAGARQAGDGTAWTAMAGQAARARASGAQLRPSLHAAARRSRAAAAGRPCAPPRGCMRRRVALRSLGHPPCASALHVAFGVPEVTPPVISDPITGLACVAPLRSCSAARRWTHRPAVFAVVPDAAGQHGLGVHAHICLSHRAQGASDGALAVGYKGLAAPLLDSALSAACAAAALAQAPRGRAAIARRVHLVQVRDWSVTLLDPAECRSCDHNQPSAGTRVRQSPGVRQSTSELAIIDQSARRTARAGAPAWMLGCVRS